MVDSLLQRVDEFQKRDHLHTLYMHSTENVQLQREILYYQRTFCDLLDLIQHARGTVQILQTALEKHFEGQIEVEKLWIQSKRMALQTRI